LENRMDLITNYFISRSSSGWVEGLNNKIKVLKRRSYGVKNLGNLFRRIWLDLRGHEAFAHWQHKIWGYPTAIPKDPFLIACLVFITRTRLLRNLTFLHLDSFYLNQAGARRVEGNYCKIYIRAVIFTGTLLPSLFQYPRRTISMLLNINLSAPVG
jgi:transposase